jgi:hypothetical protein
MICIAHSIPSRTPIDIYFLTNIENVLIGGVAISWYAVSDVLNDSSFSGNGNACIQPEASTASPYFQAGN